MWLPLKNIEKALDLIKRYHSGVRRKSGEPFYTDPMALHFVGIFIRYAKLFGFCQRQKASPSKETTIPSSLGSERSAPSDERTSPSQDRVPGSVWQTVRRRPPLRGDILD